MFQGQLGLQPLIFFDKPLKLLLNLLGLLLDMLWWLLGCLRLHETLLYIGYVSLDLVQSDLRLQLALLVDHD